MSSDIFEKSASEIAAEVACKTVSAHTIITAYLDRIESINPAVNAICTVNAAAEQLALQCDRRLAAGEAARPLEGVPVVVKDTIETQGIRTTFGSRIMEDFVPAEDAVVVERLKAAGAIVIAKTNTPEFATDINTSNPMFGMTRNPWDLNATAGGSSGGTGAALAAGMAPGGIRY